MKRIVIFLALYSLAITGWSQVNNDMVLKQYDRFWEVSPGVYRVMKDGLVGIVGEKGIVVPVDYQQVWSGPDNRYFRVMKDGKTGLYHIDRGIVIPAEYDQIWDFSDGTFRVSKDGKLGLIRASGQMVVPCEYQQIWDFNQGRAKVIREGKMGYVDWDGHEVIPAVYQQIGPFDGGMARVVREGKAGFVNESGAEVVGCYYQQVTDFSEGMARVIKDGKIGFVDTLGKEVIPPIFTQIWGFEADSAKAVLDGNVVYINRQGKVLSSAFQAVSSDATVPVSEEVPSDTLKSLRIGSNTIVVKDWDRQKGICGKEDDSQQFGKKSNNKFKGHHFGVDLGFNSYLNSQGGFDAPTGYDFLSLNNAKSVAVGVNILQEEISFSPRGNVGLVTGLGFDFNNYRFDSPSVLVKTIDGTLVAEPVAEPLKKNKLSALYLSLPVMLEWQFPVDGHKNPFYLSAGVVGGVRLRSHVKLVFDDGHKEKTRGDYNMSDLRVGAKARVGYRFINLYGTYYYTPLFDKAGDPQLYPVSIGLSFMPDWM